MKKQLIILVVAIVLIAGGVTAYAVLSKDKTHVNNTAGTAANDSMDMDDSMPSQDPKSNSGTSQDTGATGNSASGDASKAESTDQVKIANYAFSPATITVKVGTKVTWTNTDVVKHNVAMDDNADGPSSQMLAKGDTYTYTFTKAGTYKYHCTPHPYMKGTVVVAE